MGIRKCSVKYQMLTTRCEKCSGRRRPGSPSQVGVTVAGPGEGFPEAVTFGLWGRSYRSHSNWCVGVVKPVFQAEETPGKERET